MWVPVAVPGVPYAVGSMRLAVERQCSLVVRALNYESWLLFPAPPLTYGVTVGESHPLFVPLLLCPPFVCLIQTPQQGRLPPDAGSHMKQQGEVLRPPRRGRAPRSWCT